MLFYNYCCSFHHIIVLYRCLKHLLLFIAKVSAKLKPVWSMCKGKGTEVLILSGLSLPIGSLRLSCSHTDCEWLQCVYLCLCAWYQFYPSWRWWFYFLIYEVPVRPTASFRRNHWWILELNGSFQTTCFISLLSATTLSHAHCIPRWVFNCSISVTEEHFPTPW